MELIIKIKINDDVDPRKKLPYLLSKLTGAVEDVITLPALKQTHEWIGEDEDEEHILGEIVVVEMPAKMKKERQNGHRNSPLD